MTGGYRERVINRARTIDAEENIPSVDGIDEEWFFHGSQCGCLR